ncbi:hypothetical protein B0H63DRAFT_456103 [Podospora didyma]|uniref:Uncharacterized protein n=1 Tax=Podospora didyma TaxID=330526 RepID=A0AAE0JZ87_9PEZI|nr:hypothetical protein B0H63DRAFT_456103 [Podospora didyma]
MPGYVAEPREEGYSRESTSHCMAEAMKASGFPVHRYLHSDRFLPVKVDINGTIGKSFFLADNEWTCYKLNYISCVCSYSITPSSTAPIHFVQSGDKGSAAKPEKVRLAPKQAQASHHPLAMYGTGSVGLALSKGYDQPAFGTQQYGNFDLNGHSTQQVLISVRGDDGRSRQQRQRLLWTRHLRHHGIGYRAG